jgi:hypothetical protein
MQAYAAVTATTASLEKIRDAAIAVVPAALVGPQRLGWTTATPEAAVRQLLAHRWSTSPILWTNTAINRSKPNE